RSRSRRPGASDPRAPGRWLSAALRSTGRGWAKPAYRHGVTGQPHHRAASARYVGARNRQMGRHGAGTMPDRLRTTAIAHACGPALPPVAGHLRAGTVMNKHLPYAARRARQTDGGLRLPERLLGQKGAGGTLRRTSWFAARCLFSLAFLLAGSDVSAQEYRCRTIPGKITFSGRTLDVVGQVSSGAYLGGISAYLSKTQFSLQCGNHALLSTAGLPAVVITTPGAGVASTAEGSVIRMPNTDIGLKFYYDLISPPTYNATYGGVMFTTPLFHIMNLQQGA